MKQESESKIAAIQNLIASLTNTQQHGNIRRRLPLLQETNDDDDDDDNNGDAYLKLAERILSSSIGQISKPKSKMSHMSLLKKIERSYRKRVSGATSSSVIGVAGAGERGDNDLEQDLKDRMNRMRSLYGVIVKSGGLDDQVVSNLMLLFSRLAGTCSSSGSIGGVSGSGRSSISTAIKTNRAMDKGASTRSVPRATDSMAKKSSASVALETEQKQGIFFGVEHSKKNPSSLPSMKHVQLAIQNEERDLLRECLYSLQYIDGTLLQFQRDSSDAISQDSSTTTTTTRRVYNPLWSPSDVPVDSSSSSSTSQSQRGGIIQGSGIRVRPGLLPFHLTPDQRYHHRHIRTCLGGGEDAIRICGEAGWLYDRIERYMNHKLLPLQGVVPRALASALRKEMDSYHAFLKDLESMWSQGDLTLRKLMVLLRGPIGHLRTLALIVDGVSGETNNGGQLLTSLYLHSMHGDERCSAIVDRILFEASVPWYDLLYDWTMRGILSEGGQKSQEFFIVENRSVKDAYLWHGRYVLQEEQIPHVPGIGERGGLLSERLAKEILIVGKGINFIRKCLHDSDWDFDLRELLPRKVLENNNNKGMEDGKSHHGAAENVHRRRQIQAQLGFYHDGNAEECFDISGKSGRIITQTALEKTIAVAASQVHLHILTSLFEQHHLLQHLRGLKEILFLGQGDFICALMDGLHAEFESRGSVHEIHMISLMNIVHDALRSTNAKFLPKYVTDRVQVRMLSEQSSADVFWSEKNVKETEKEGWDIFTLDYAIDVPLTAIVHPEAMEKYHLVFNLLFKLKRIEWMMNNTWRQSTTLNHSLQLMISKFGTVELAPSGTVGNGGTAHAISRMKRLLRKFSMSRQCMLHFLTNLQSYLMFEVLESGWKDLVQKLGCAKTLDEVISSHDEYLNDILEKSLVGEALSTNDTSGGELPKQLRLVLSAAFRFCKMHEKIFSHGVETIQKATEKRRGAQKRSANGGWGYEKFDADVEGMNFYSLADETRLAEVESVSEEFDISLRNLLSMLNDRINGNSVRDVDISSPPMERPSQTVESDRANAIKTDSLRFLTFRLDFSAYYGL